MRIQLLTFPGCAHAPAARELLSRVLAGDGLAFEEIDTEAPGAPERYRSYASPTILVDGVAVGGGGVGPAGCCRLYLDDSGRKLVGLPSEAAVRSAMARASRDRRTAAT